VGKILGSYSDNSEFSRSKNNFLFNFKLYNSIPHFSQSTLVKQQQIVAAV